MTRCNEIQDALAAEAAGEIDAEALAVLAVHLGSCPACSRDRDRLRAALADLGAEPVPDPGPLYWASFEARLRQRIAAARSTASRRRRVLAAAAAVAVCGLGLAVILRFPGRRPGHAGGPGLPQAAAGGSVAPDAVEGAREGGTVGEAAALAEARLEAAIRTLREGDRGRADGALEAILDDVAPGDPFALAGGLDAIDNDSGADSGV
jgi:hypothetical protein